MSTLITLDSVLLSTLVALLTFVVWAGHRYITRDDAWKQNMDNRMQNVERRLAETMTTRSICIQDFALKKEVNELFVISRDHGERIARLETAAGK